jgi:uncharacterized membrane protein
MITFIKTAFMFAAGSMLGWFIELIYRRFFDPTNPERRWLNPGFLAGPYLPIYGFVLILLYDLKRLERFMPFTDSTIRTAALILLMAACITAVEYLTGLIFIKKLKIMLWDYTQFRGNIRGIICPLYSFFWVLLSIFYCLVLDRAVTYAADFITGDLRYTVFVAAFYAVLFFDLGISVKKHRINSQAGKQTGVPTFEERPVFPGH